MVYRGWLHILLTPFEPVKFTLTAAHNQIISDKIGVRFYSKLEC